MGSSVKASVGPSYCVGYAHNHQATADVLSRRQRYANQPDKQPFANKQRSAAAHSSA
jgi:hypothetical protein